jgi:rhodanese-related sulfurtransferase
MKTKWIAAMLGLAGIIALSVSCAADERGSDLEPTAPPAVTQVQQTGQTQAEYRKITADEAKEKMDENESVIVVDVRTQSEYDERHIEGAILIPNETIGDTMPEQLPDLNAEILIYCRSGNRSRQAAEKLIALGYTQVYDFGGIIDWLYETVSSDE